MNPCCLVNVTLRFAGLELAGILARICTSVLSERWSRRRLIPFAIKAKAETVIMVLNCGICSTPVSLRITSVNPITASKYIARFRYAGRRYNRSTGSTDPESTNG